MPSIDSLDWGALARAGFRGCVFDKDNTLTAPYAAAVAPALRPALERCRAAFDGRLVLFSNSAGLAQYDPEGALRMSTADGQAPEEPMQVAPSAAAAPGNAVLPDIACYPCWYASSQGSFSAFALCKRLHICGAGPEQGAVRGAGREAEALEAALSIPVLRHAQKKPAGDAAEAEAHFGCAQASR